MIRLHYFAVIISLVAFPLQLMAQTHSDSIQITSDSIKVSEDGRGFYEYKEAILDLKQVLHVTEKNSEAHLAISKAIRQRNGSILLGAIGGVIIGYTFASALNNVEPTWWIGGIGVGIGGISALISGESNKNARRGIALHNAGLKDRNESEPVRLGMTSTGLGISWQF